MEFTLGTAATQSRKAVLWATNVRRSQRAGALAAVIVAHAALLAILLLMRSPESVAGAEVGALTVVSIADDSEAMPPPPPTMPSKVVREVVDLAQLALSVETEPSASTASAGGCAALEAVTQALLADPVAVAAVVRAPPETRSIAEAIVVWNTGWSEATATAGSPLEPVRVRVTEALVSLDGDCLDQPIAGPRLVPIPVGEGTMFLVFGAGSWTWRQLMLVSEPTDSAVQRES